MAGITELGEDVISVETPGQGAVDVARWDSGVPLLATRPHVAALNLFVALPGYASGQVGELLRNALIWSVGQVDWLALSGTRFTVEPGAEVVVDADFDATSTVAGVYTADLVVVHDDPAQGEVRLPVRFTVTGEPRLRLTAGEAVG